MRFKTLALVLFTSPLAAQTPRALTASDYARAERFLGTTTAPLVSGLGVRANWLDDGRFWYRVSRPNGFEFVVVDPAKRTRTPAFDQPRLAAALNAIVGGTTQVDPNRLPFQSFQYSKDMRSITLTASSRRFTCDLQTYQCAPVDTTPTAGTVPENSIVSPDGQRAAFIRDFNLWVKDLTTGRETQLTTDGVKDFGYATDNAGWVHSDRTRPHVVRRFEEDRDVPARRPRSERHVSRLDQRGRAEARGLEVSAAGRQRDLPDSPGRDRLVGRHAARGALPDAAGPASLDGVRPRELRRAHLRRALVSRRLARRVHLGVARSQAGVDACRRREHGCRSHPVRRDVSDAVR